MMHNSRPLLVVLAILQTATTLAARGKPTMTLDDVARLKKVSDVLVSPDGRTIAFLHHVPRNAFTEADGPARTHLMVKRGDALPRLYVRGDLIISAIAWAADSRTIHYLGEDPDSGDNALYAMPLDGGAPRTLCQLEAGRRIEAFAVHPDGQRLALAASPKRPEAEKRAEEKGFDAVVFQESVPVAQLAIVSPQPGARCDMAPFKLDGHVSAVAFSPSGDRLLANVAPTASVDDGYMKTRLRVLRQNGSQVARINNLGKLEHARWSPDSRHIAFLGVDDYHDPAAGRLKVADAKTGRIRDLLPDLSGHVRALAWLGPDEIVAVVHLGVTSELWKVRLKSGKHQVVVAKGGPISREVSASLDGRTVALAADAPRHPQELFKLSAGKLERLTVSNPWLTERTLGRQEVVSYKASDGLALQGLLVYPVGYRKGRRYPLLIFVHGGPEAHRSHGWLSRYSNPVHVAAARGYVSFVPNYRGSTGRGVAFSKLDQHAYATPEFDDIVDGKDHLVARGLVDKRKVGITGGSYGGYATAWSATALSEHYAAGVMFAGISSQISKFGTSDIPREMHAVHARAWPWEDWQFMLERSPIYHLQKGKTPLLIIHGDADTRVHPSQSLEMYQYLKLANQVPVRLVWYPGEKHGIRRAAARYDYSVRLMRWMDYYLKGSGGKPPPYQIDYRDRLKKDNGS